MSQTAQPKKNKALMATQKKHAGLIITPPPSRFEAQRSIVVLGVERGGTSMAAGVIRALGVDMGRRAGLNHEDPRFLTEDRDAIAQVIARRKEENAVWGFKMPKSVFMLDFLEQHLPNPYYVVVHRNLAAVADSWTQRGAGNPLDALDRGLTYHRLITDHMKKTKRPVLVLNYERAVKDAAHTAQLLADFFGLAPDAATLDKAASMVTGDGKGYVNLPEFFFAATPLDTMPDRPRLDTTSNAGKLTEADGTIIFRNQARKLILQPQAEGPLPSALWLRLTLDAPESFDLSTDPIRLFFDFTGELFAGHCIRPRLHRGVNTLLVETSGDAKRLALAPINPGPGLRLRLEAEVFAAEPQDETLAEAAADSGHAATVATPSRQKRGFSHKVRALLRRGR